MTKLDSKILQKLEYYCAYQDRCEQEVTQKCLSLGVDSQQIIHYISTLKEDKFIDEQRFAESFVRGKHLYKKWGKIKITQHLRQKKIPTPLIEKALKEIEDKYYDTFYTIAEKKWEELPNTSQKSKDKWVGFLHRKGYELHLIFELLKDFSNE